MEAASNLVPNELFNVIAWTTGMATDITTDALRVSVSVEDSHKILSSCQDMMNLAMRGRVLMPKHSFLAMAVRHLTGSTQLMGILNGLGHCSSNSQVLEHDTALAQLQVQRGNTYIPPNMHVKVPATLVWDNNDFGEETLPGKGTTHNTKKVLLIVGLTQHERAAITVECKEMAEPSIQAAS